MSASTIFLERLHEKEEKILLIKVKSNPSSSACASGCKIKSEHGI